MELAYTIIASVMAVVMSWRATKKAAPFSLLATLAIGLTAMSIVRILNIFEALRTKSGRFPDALFYVTGHKYLSMAYVFAIVIAVGLAAWQQQLATPLHARTQRVVIMALTFGALAPPLLHRAFIPDLNAPLEPSLLSQILNYAGPCIVALAACTLIALQLLALRTACQAKASAVSMPL